MKKIISIIMSVVMVFTIGAVSFSTEAFATETESAQSTVVNEEALINAFADTVGDLNLDSLRIPTSWDDLGDMLLKVLYSLADKLIDIIVSTINYVIPSVNFDTVDTYDDSMFFPGMDSFISSPVQGARWNLGYASASLQTGDELDGEHFVGGSLSFPDTKAATAVYDDQRVRVIAVNDNSGRGTVVFAVLDAFGMSNTDVRGIRKVLADFAKEKNIIGINISVLHQHSCVDTFGMNGDLVKMLFANPAANIANNNLGTDFTVMNGQNKSFMENVYKVTSNAIKEAVNSMQSGKMLYSEIDATEYIHDKREPMVYDTDIHRLRFVPDNGGMETWICNMAIHCVGNGAAGTEVTGDYPYYMEKVINEAGANFIEIQGAELAITSEYDAVNMPEGLKRIEELALYGEALGNLVVNSTATETEVAPMLNYTMDEYNVPVTNEILEFAGRMGALSNTVIKVDNEDYDIVIPTEIGFAEFGDISVAIIPGELEPAIAYGGYLTADNSWRAEDFDYPCFKDIIGKDKTLLVFGLTNDQIGYILEDNDYSSILSGVNEEIVAAGDMVGSTTINAFETLYNGIKR